jgi:uncharacterized protein (TIGR00369 family)
MEPEVQRGPIIEENLPTFAGQSNFRSMPQQSSPEPVHSLAPSADGDYSSALNARVDGWNQSMGLRFVRATPDEVTAEIEIAACHLQAYGIVHGGVYSGMIETVASVGAALWAGVNNQAVVGVENHTSFLHAVRQDSLRATARPLMRGRRTQVWQATVTDGADRTVAEGRVRFLALEAGSALAGETVQIKSLHQRPGHSK